MHDIRHDKGLDKPTPMIILYCGGYVYNWYWYWYNGKDKSGQDGTIINVH